MNKPELPSPSFIDSEQLIEAAHARGLQLDMRSLGVYIHVDELIRPAYATFSLSEEIRFRGISLADYREDDLNHIEYELALKHWEKGITPLSVLDAALSEKGVAPLSKLPLSDLPAFLYRANFGTLGGRLAKPDAETLAGPLVTPFFESFDGVPHLIVRAQRIHPTDFNDPIICSVEEGQVFPSEEVDRFFNLAQTKKEGVKELSDRSERSHLITIAMLASMLSERAPKFKKGDGVNAQAISDAAYEAFGDPAGCKPQTVAKRIRLGVKALEEDM